MALGASGDRSGNICSGLGLGSQPASAAEGGAGGAVSSGGGAEPQHRRTEPYLQLKPLGLFDVPFHHDFSNTRSADGGEHVSLEDFLPALLSEAKAWDATEWTSSGKWVSKDPDTLGLECDKFKKRVGDDTWFARYSRHKDHKPYQFSVFDQILRAERTRHELKYTPNIFDATELVSWHPEHLDEIAAPLGFKDVGMGIVEMYHSLDFPLSPRVFSLLLLVARRSDLTYPETNTMAESIIVQLPIDLRHFPKPVQERRHHNANMIYAPLSHLPSTTESRKKIGKTLVQAHYASIEKIERHHPGPQTDDFFIENRWTMSTVSDARGVLPRMLQNCFVPDEICKDVEYVWKYIADEKHRQNLGLPEWYDDFRILNPKEVFERLLVDRLEQVRLERMRDVGGDE